MAVIQILCNELIAARTADSILSRLKNDIIAHNEIVAGMARASESFFKLFGGLNFLASYNSDYGTSIPVTHTTMWVPQKKQKWVFHRQKG